MRLEGKTAFVTGADSGIGRAVAIAFAREGADVVISYLSEDDDAQDTAGWVRRAGRDVVLVPGGEGNRPLMDDEPVLSWLRQIDERTRWTTSVCTGSLVLGAAGLLPASTQIGQRCRFADDDAGTLGMAALHPGLACRSGIARIAISRKRLRSAESSASSTSSEAGGSVPSSSIRRTAADSPSRSASIWASI